METNELSLIIANMYIALSFLAEGWSKVIMAMVGIVIITVGWKK